MVKSTLYNQQITLKESFTLLSGKDFWATSAVYKYGIGSLKFSDGPNGVRGEEWTQGAPSVCVPCGTSLGATFDAPLVQEIGKLLGVQSHDKSVDVLLGPTMNIHRYTLCGRNFESYSEDPYLTGALASAYINGIQSQGVSACPKHFLANEAEDGRRWTDSVINERTLREIYLEPFRIVVADSNPWCLMTAYNSLNGSFCSESKTLLSILKDEWKYSGVVVSDWFGTYSTAAAINAGLDLEMPGPSKFRTPAQLESAIKDSDITEEQVIDSTRRIVNLIHQTGNLEKFNESSNQKNERQSFESRPGEGELLKKAALAGFVLLKNDADALPLATYATHRVMITGKYALDPAIHGGGSASLRTPHVTTPLAAVQKHYMNTHYCPGVPVNRLVSIPQAKDFDMSEIALEWYNGPGNCRESSFKVEWLEETQYMLVEHVPEGLLDKTNFSTRMCFSTAPRVSGDYDISLCGPGSMRCYVDGELVHSVQSDLSIATENYLFDRSKLETRRPTALRLEAGTTYHFEVVNSSSKHEPQHVNREFFIQGSRLGLALVDDSDAAIDHASDCARNADTAIIVVGTGPEWESEGFDRSDMSLPRRQNELISRVAASCKGKSIVVINSGSAIDTSPWIDQVDAVIQAWFPGMEFGDALIDLLNGTFSPCGRLPTTFHDTIAMTAAGDVGRRIGCDSKIHYNEGRFLGYRRPIENTKSSSPRFAFGHGLSYTTFKYKLQELSTALSGPESFDIHIEVLVENTGSIPGSETVLLFVKSPSLSDRPEAELKAFAKTQCLAPGESETVSIHLGRMAFACWASDLKSWNVEEGAYEILFAGRRGAYDWIEMPEMVIDVPNVVFL